MSADESSFTPNADGTEIATIEWIDAVDQPRGMAQIADGLAEHAARYSRFAEALNGAGFLAYATDHLGHGRTGQANLGDFGEAGFDGLIADVAQYGASIADEHPGLPLFLFGHSMGSFASQVAIIEHSDSEIARTFVFFASDASAYITGQVLPVDGGMVI